MEKTINISEENWKFLQAFMDRINTQDNRSTATPIYYTIQERKKRYSRDFDSCDGECYCATNDFFEIGDCHDLKKYLIENYPEYEEVINKLVEDNEGYDWDVVLEDFCEGKKLSIERLAYVWERPERSFFLTEQACEQHIKLNHYHYSEPHSYVHHAWRYPELEQLLQTLGEITGKKYVTH